MPVTHREMNIIPLVLNAKIIFFKMHWLIRLNFYFSGSQMVVTDISAKEGE